MDYIRGVTRNQVILFPETVEDYITADNPVRFIDAFVASLELAALGFMRAQPGRDGAAGLRSGRPVAALSLWLSESGALVADAGARGESESRSDVAVRKARSGLQDHC